MSSSSQITLSPAAQRLSEDEQRVYQDYVASGKPSLSVTLNANLYGLFLAGSSVDDMVALNKGLSKGVILKARVDGDWDRRRETYLQELQFQAQDRVKLIALESVNFMGLLLSAAHKEHGEKLKQYLQSGNPDDLGTFAIDSIKQYKEAIEMLVKITGQDKPKAPVTNVNNVSVAPGGTANIGPARFTPDQAEAILKALDKQNGS